jgi:hypothetical protein
VATYTETGIKINCTTFTFAKLRQIARAIRIVKEGKSKLIKAAGKMNWRSLVRDVLVTNGNVVVSWRRSPNESVGVNVYDGYTTISYKQALTFLEKVERKTGKNILTN